MSDNAPSIDLLLEELCEVVEWYTLGAYLGLTENEIKEIEQDHRETARRRMAMLSKWIKKKANPSWLAIIAALEKMSESSLANLLRKKYIRDEKSPDAEPTAELSDIEAKKVVMKMNRKEMIVRELEEVEKKYLRLIVETESAMKSVNPPPEELKRFSRFYTNVRVTTVEELFDHLEQYCFLDYTLLETVISFFLDNRALFVVSELRAYIQHLDGFKSSTTIRQFMESIEIAQKQLTTTDGGVERCTVILRLVGGWLEKTMTDLDKLLKELFQDKRSVLSHIQIVRGSLIVTYWAPQLKAKSLKSLVMKTKLSLSQVGVCGLLVADTVVVHMQSNPFISFESSLYKAIFNADINLLSFLLNINTNPNKIEIFPQGRDFTPLLFAVTGFNLFRIYSMVDLLLKANADPNLQLKDGATPLILASELGYTDIVRLLIQANADPNLPLADGSSAIHTASRKGYSDVVRVLLGANVDPNCQTKMGDTALSTACFNGHTAVVSMLLNANADPNISKSDNITPLHMASQNGHYDIVNMLLKANANPNLQADNGVTPLYYSCQYGHTNIVKLLLKAKANPDIQAGNQSTPLYMASQKGFINIVDLLLAAKANPNYSCMNRRALHISSQLGHSGIVDCLLKVKANPDFQTNEGWTPILFACENGHFDVVDLLLKANANPILSTHDGATPMTMASHCGHSDIVRILLDANVDPNYQTYQCPSPVVYACLNRKPETVRLLLTRGANPNLQHSPSTITALMCACFSGCLESAELLLMSGADPSVVGPEGLTALDIAAWAGHYDIVHLIQAVELSQSSTTSPVSTANEIATNVSNEAMSLLNKVIENMLVAKSEDLISTHYKHVDKKLPPKQSQELHIL